MQTALNAGELSPEIFGRVDLSKYRLGASTMRNMFASYRGGAYSRAGTLFCGICRQGAYGHANDVPPPRNIAFQFSVTQGITIEAGEKYFRFISAGGYITETPQTILGITQGNPVVVVTPSPHGFNNGDDVFLAGTTGMPQISGQIFTVENASSTSFTPVSLLTGQTIDGAHFSPYTGGGTVARIYNLITPYAAADLPALKWAQSADVMTFTHPSYPPYDLSRIAPDNWTLIATTFRSSIDAPASMFAQATTSGNFYYTFVSTAVDSVTHEESVASVPYTISSADIAATAGSLILTCNPVSQASSYNFYTVPECYGSPPTAGSLFGYIGSSFGPTFTDTNIVPDYNTPPPLHRNPFATSSVIGVDMTALGASYNPTATTASVISPIGQNPVLIPVVVSGDIRWVIVANGGAGMTGGEAVHFIDSTGSGSGATATIRVGPATGTFPSCVAYFQQRRVYGNTNNAPDTYFASQTGAFTNMDSSLPVVASDAIIGSPWSQQVNGIQWMLNMPGGLVIFTGLGAWQLSGAGSGLSTSAALTPENQVANPQAYNGCSPTVPPIAINYDILYVQEKGSIVRDLSYNFFVNIYTGTDMTVLSNHLFDGHTIVQWAWAEEPNKLLWAIRDDGILLCLTYLKEQDVYAWSRHDTNGLVQSVCSISEPPVNAPYFVVKRLIQNGGHPVWVYFQERMDNRLWQSQQTAWCVDAGLSYLHSAPNAILEVSSARGVPTLNQPSLVYGGRNYSSMTYGEIIDPTGSGATLNLTISGGIIQTATITGTLADYTAPVIRIIDPSGLGGGAVINISLDNVTTVTASAPVFANLPGQGEAGDVIQMGGRQIVVTAFLDHITLTGNVVQPHQTVIPNDPKMTATPAMPDSWTIASPISTVYGLGHLEGMLVSILADGVVVNPQVVVNGAVTLPQPATQIVVGLGFAAQLQTLYLDIQGGVTVQGRRKEIDSVVLRINATGTPFEVGTNQPDASTQPGMVTIPWENMTGIQGGINGGADTGSGNPLQPYDLNTDDVFADVIDQLGITGGQVAIQQTAPLPLGILAIIPWARIGDDVDA